MLFDVEIVEKGKSWGLNDTLGRDRDGEERVSKTEYTYVGKLKIDDDFSNGWGDCGGVMMTSIVKTRMIIWEEGKL